MSRLAPQRPRGHSVLTVHELRIGNQAVRRYGEPCCYSAHLHGASAQLHIHFFFYFSPSFHRRCRT
jgi:hypothetical protein